MHDILFSPKKLDQQLIYYWFSWSWLCWAPYHQSFFFTVAFCALLLGSEGLSKKHWEPIHPSLHRYHHRYSAHRFDFQDRLPEEAKRCWYCSFIAEVYRFAYLGPTPGGEFIPSSPATWFAMATCLIILVNSHHFHVPEDNIRQTYFP